MTLANGLSENPSLGEISDLYLANLPSDEARESQQEINRFVRWFSRERPAAEISAAEIDNYAQQLSSLDTDYTRKLALVRAFLTQAKKQKWTNRNLAVHLKVKRPKVRLGSSARHGLGETVTLTRQGYAELESELDTLKAKRVQAIDETRRAAADKDFRENAPLEAAREQLGHIEGRIRKVEDILKSAVIIDGKPESALKADIRDSVIVCDLASGEKMCCVIVSPTEVDPAAGKISSASPLGKAIIGHGEGEVIDIKAPAGKLQYRIEQVKH